MTTSFKLAGDKGIVMEFKNIISKEVNEKVRGMQLAINKVSPDGVEEVIPAYRSLLILYDPLIIDTEELIEQLEEIEDNINKFDFKKPRVIKIPTVYGGEYGPDLDYVAEYNDLKKDEIISIHTDCRYLVYMLGFTPGFAYLGGMPEKIASPRLDNPREKIPRGSVGIAGSQTGIYPIDSPGGWRLIGRTPLDLFDPYRETPFLIKVGDYLKFEEITENEYLQLREKVKNNEFLAEII
jgi:KipI family sensor histidine kinase inhibitor